MNSDIRLSVTFPDHPKTINLKNILGIKGVWSLINLWIFTAKYKPDGRLTKMNFKDIAIAAKWKGNPDKFVNTLLHEKSQFLDVDSDGTVIVHDWFEHNNYAAHAKTRSEKARKAAAARWGQNENTNATYKNEQCSEHTTSIAPSPSPAPIPSPFPKKNIYDHSFERFWSAYPRKVAKKEAYKVWIKLNSDNGLMEKIIEAVEKAKRSIEWTKNKGEFIPHPTTYLNQERWNDELTFAPKAYNDPERYQ